MIIKDILAAMLIWLMVYIVFLSIPTARANTEEDRVGVVYESINWLLKPAPNRRLSRDGEKKQHLAQDIVSAAKQWEVPSLLLAVIAFRESSFNTRALGDLGERGLTQVHGMASRGCVLDSQLGQLSCGARWLARGKKLCGSWNGAVTAYACGSCTTSNEHVKRLVDSRLRLWKKLEEMFCK